MSRSENEVLLQILKSNGYQNTKARQATFALLLHAEPQSMPEILRKAVGSVDRVSVYRNLDLFEKLGICQRIYIGWKYKIELTDQFTEHHHHLSCLGCGATIAIKDERHIDDFISNLARQYAFTPRRHQFEIDGYCRDCSE